MVVEAIYENGVLKPLDTSGLKEHGRYWLILEEIAAPESARLKEEMQKRLTILPDGRRIARLSGSLTEVIGAIAEDEDPTN